MNISSIKAIIKKELLEYFQTPIAYIIIAIFLAVSGSLTFFPGYFIGRNVAGLDAFFMWHSWLYILLVPAITMRLWAEEKQLGTIELLLTFPISLPSLVIGKFLSAWIFAIIALAGTLPMWWTVNYLGQPDNGVIFAGYIGSILMSGGYIAIGSCISAMTKSQIISFIVTLMICLIFTASGEVIIVNFIDNWLPQILVETISQFSFATNFESITKGLLKISSLIYFISLIILWLFLNVLALENRRS